MSSCLLNSTPDSLFKFVHLWSYQPGFFPFKFFLNKKLLFQLGRGVLSVVSNIIYNFQYTSASWKLKFAVIMSQSQIWNSLRTEVSPWNQIFLGCCFPSKIYDDVNLLYLWLAKKRNNQPCQYFMESTGFLANRRYRRLATSWFFDGK